MAEVLSLREVVRHFVHGGGNVALEDFTHPIPTAASYELIRQGRKGLVPIRTTLGLVYDLLIGAGCAKRLVFSWGDDPGTDSLHRLRDTVEKGWPQPLKIEECSHADLANAHVAGASGLLFAVLRTYAGSDLLKVNPPIRGVACPLTGEVLAVVPSVCPDASVIHAQKANRKGNVLLWGIFGMQKEAALAARRCIVTVKEVVDELDAPMNVCVLPSWASDAVCLVPDSAYPFYAHDYYERDNRFYQDWDLIVRDHESLIAWIDEYIRGTEDFGTFQAKLAEGKR